MKTICPHCHREFDVKENLLQQDVNCSVCHKDFTVTKVKFCSKCKMANPAQAFECWLCKNKFKITFKTSSYQDENEVQKRRGEHEQQTSSLEKNSRLNLCFHWAICFLHYGVAAALCLLIIVLGCKMEPNSRDEICYTCNNRLATRLVEAEYQEIKRSEPSYSYPHKYKVSFRLCNNCNPPLTIINASSISWWWVQVGKRNSTNFNGLIILADILIAMPMLLMFMIAHISRRQLTSGETPSWRKLWNIQPSFKSSESGLAIVAFWICISSLFLLAPVAGVLGIFALRDIKRNPTKTEKWRAIFAIVAGFVVGVLIICAFTGLIIYNMLTGTIQY